MTRRPYVNANIVNALRTGKSYDQVAAELCYSVAYVRSTASKARRLLKPTYWYESAEACVDLYMMDTVDVMTKYDVTEGQVWYARHRAQMRRRRAHRSA